MMANIHLSFFKETFSPFISEQFLLLSLYALLLLLLNNASKDLALLTICPKSSMFFDVSACSFQVLVIADFIVFLKSESF